jgi:hypothetical protein
MTEVAACYGRPQCRLSLVLDHYEVVTISWSVALRGLRRGLGGTSS